MELRPYQVCRSRDGWVPVQVPSGSQPDLTYLVLVNPWGNSRENVCECPGYTYRGTCKHQEFAGQSLCGWIEGELPLQDNEHREKKICPRCKGPSKWELDVIE